MCAILLLSWSTSRCL